MSLLGNFYRFPPIFFGIFGWIVCLGGLPFVAQAQEESSEDVLISLEGESTAGQIEKIVDGNQLVLAGVDAPQSLDRLRLIRRPGSNAQQFKPVGQGKLYLSGGGELRFTEATIDENQDCHFKITGLAPLNLLIDDVHAIVFDASQPLPDIFHDALKENAEEDRIFVSVGDRLESISGLIETCDDKKIIFDVDGKLRDIARDKLYGIVMAQVGRNEGHLGECKVTLGETGYVWGKINKMQDGQLSLRLAERTDIAIPWSGVQQIEVRSDRLVFLSDLEPIEATHQPLLTLKRPWKRDRSIGGRPLTLDEQTFNKGIGVASRSRLTFAIGGRFTSLAATIGIDDETEGRGDCEFIVLGDGKELFRQRVKGKDPAKKISVDINDIDRVTLLIEPGEDLDLADHANWCDVRCVRE